MDLTNRIATLLIEVTANGGVPVAWEFGAEAFDKMRLEVEDNFVDGDGDKLTLWGLPIRPNRLDDTTAIDLIYREKGDT